MTGWPAGGIRGLDISHHNGAVDWPTVHAAGCRFVYLKAGEGLHYTDPTTPANHKAARAAGLAVGLYHFAHPSSDAGGAVMQAERFARQVGKLGPGDLPPALDLEDAGGLKPAALELWAVTFLHRLEQLIGRRPVLYTFPAFLHGQLAGGRQLLAGYQLWWARYAAELPSGDPRPRVWQFTSSGHVPGVPARADLDVFLGGEAAFAAFCGLVPAPAPVHPTPAPKPPQTPARPPLPHVPPRPAPPVNVPTTATTKEPPVRLVDLRHASDRTHVVGHGVKALQVLLIAAGCLKGPATGRAGAGTRAALVTFQRSHKLEPVDAIAGPATFAALIDYL